MSEEVKQLFTSISPTYDCLNHLLSFRIDQGWRKKTINSIVFPKDQSLKALDVCAGTLDLSIAFLNLFKNSRVWAADFSSSMLEMGRKKLNVEQAKRTHFVCADALNLPFENENFDVIFCGYGFRNLDDQQKGLSEMHRVLKPGGQLLILEFFRPQTVFSRLFHHSYGRFIMPTIGSLVSKNKNAYRYLHDSISRFYSLEECKELFIKEGFKQVQSRQFLMGISALVSGQK